MAFSKYAEKPGYTIRDTGWLTERPFAHRGLHGCGQLPVENSLSAFRAAVDAGFGIELDVQCSADGVAMVFHDHDLARLTRLDGLVSRQTADELGRIRLTGSDDTILPLAKVLDSLPDDLPVLVEVKGEQPTDGRLEYSVASAANTRPKRIAVMSFWPASLMWFGENTPQFPRGLVATTRPAADLGETLTRPAAQKRLMARLEPDFIAYDIKSLANTVSLAARQQGLPVLTWTVRSGADHERAAKYADNIIFEQPDK